MTLGTIKKVANSKIQDLTLHSDPGKGIRRLRRAGVRVDVGLLEAECRRLNEAFIKYITRRIPFVVLKLAASLD
ncbi:MAG: riboflavin biosynthesis protein RibD, partial [Deltaproteobacteria bacterium]|nr:riboflavin biosynthesis protein RibD [Deltaproteobacteria bacterium]